VVSASVLNRADEPADRDETTNLPAFEERVLATGLRIAVVGVVVQTAVHLVNAASWQKYQLNANNEGTAFAWASVAATFGVALAAAVIALAASRGRRRLFVLAGLVAFLSLDDMVAVHERASLETVRVLGLSDMWDSVFFALLYGPLFAAVMWLLVHLARDGSAQGRRAMHWGLGLLVFAVAAEALSAKWPPVNDPYDWVHVIEGGAEEAAELGGWILIASATIATGARLAARRGRLARRAR
jgi:hypothetical protein